MNTPQSDFLRAAEKTLLVILGIVMVVGTILPIADLKWPFLGWGTETKLSCLLAFVSLIGVSLLLDRFTSVRRIEHALKMQAQFADITKNLPNHAAEHLMEVVQNYCAYHGLLRDLEKRHETYQHKLLHTLGTDVFKDLNEKMKWIAGGRMRIITEHGQGYDSFLRDRCKERFDACSYCDLKFWEDRREFAQQYRQRYLESQRAAGRARQINRIFIIKLETLKADDERAQLVRVLRLHANHGVGWGVALEEELDSSIRDLAKKGWNSSNGSESDADGNYLNLDFALCDRNQSVMFFKETPRRCEVRLWVDEKHENAAMIRVYRAIFRNLIAECYIVDGQFMLQYRGALENPEKDLEEIMDRTRNSNKNWERLLGRSFETDDPTGCFPFIADNNSLEKKLLALRDLMLAKYPNP